MKVAVFGAAGWLGRAILDNLEGRHDVRAVDRGPEAWEAEGEWQGGDIVHGDIADFSAVEAALDDVDAVIHAAVLAGDYGVDSEAPFLVNLKGLWNVLEVVRQRRIGRVVHIGS